MEVRNAAHFCLYVITPKMTGVYSVAEVVDDSNKRPSKTLFCVLEEDGVLGFEPHQLKSLKAVRAMVLGNGSYVFGSLDEVADFLNQTIPTHTDRDFFNVWTDGRNQ